MSASGGFVRLWRSLSDHPAFADPCDAMAFAWLILNAAWKPATVRYRGFSISLKRGQIAISVRDLAKAFHRTKHWADALLKRLKTEQIVGIEIRTLGRTQSGHWAGHRAHIITICNYSLYQGERVEARTPGRTSTRTPAGQRTKKEKEHNPPIAPRKRGAGGGDLIPIPPNWRPPAIAALSPKAMAAASHWPAGAYETEAENFAQFHRGRGDAKVNWRAAWASRVLDVDKQIRAESTDRARPGSRARGGEPIPLYQLLAEGRVR